MRSERGADARCRGLKLNMKPNASVGDRAGEGLSAQHCAAYGVCG